MLISDTFTFGSTQARKRKDTGFTLIELLVVIAIIALLSAILFPVFARARENARRSSCQSNLKQIGIGIMQYSQDYDEQTPSYPCCSSTNLADFMNPNGPGYSPYGWWATPFYEIQPYIKNIQIYNCPSAPIDTAAGWGPTALTSTNYTYSAVVTNRSLAQFTNTAGIVSVQEWGDLTNHLIMIPDGGVYGGGTSFTKWHDYESPVEYSSNLHFNGGNLLFCDGHVKWQAYLSQHSGEFGLTPDQPYSTSTGGPYTASL